MTALRLTSKYALLDVERGCFALESRLAKGEGPVEVIIRGRITSAFGSHDGTSMEFNVEVDKVEANAED